MKTIDLNEMRVQELEMNDAINANGGLMIIPSAWLNALVTYVKYSMDTGGQYVIHHAQ